MMEDTATIPTVNIHKCDGDGKCVDVCPNAVFEMYALTDEEVRGLPLLARLKVRIKGAEKSRPVHSIDCVACGLCVENCHEHAIELVGRQEPSAVEPIEPLFHEPASCGMQS